MREVLRPMPKMARNECRVCKKPIRAGSKSYALFELNTKTGRLHIDNAHPRCARNAGLLVHRNAAITDAQVVRFWENVTRLKLGKGIENFVC